MKNERETLPVPTSPTTQQPPFEKDCLTCKVIGSTAFAVTGLYALHASRASAPGSIIGKRIMGGVGICESSRPYPPALHVYFLDCVRRIGTPRIDRL
ncbi:hypothetical protein F5J12DRAFT_796022 [Pisolithus orientalis]|uniref:uncharacterized protein n=1 Tax=Pisolithus orientalis TaxID=936130 RepID=UPI002225A79B|nr:uncharacterized protein F5J12DRAFT_796022 [Pisolithus orientalis]KAI6032706.1 hypothetical protein F5J12DRAFT_796022 [Pisolithus orientalis]